MDEQPSEGRAGAATASGGDMAPAGPIDRPKAPAGPKLCSADNVPAGADR
jgi:hypothetical protein